MKKFFKQLYLLQWKNIKLKQRQWVKTSIELVMPLVFFMILVAVRQSQDFIKSSPECDYRPAPLASNGGILGALRSACHLGVCHSREAVSSGDSVNSEWYVNATAALVAVNKLLADPLVRSAAEVALKVMPTNWIDPEQVKQVPLKSLFNRPEKLFTGVNATDDEISQFLTATVPMPKKLNLRLDPLLRFALSTQQSSPVADVAPQVCRLFANKSLCSQARFRGNLAKLFSPVRLVDQLASSDPFSISLPIRTTTVTNLRPLVSDLVSLKDAGVLDFLDDIWSRLAALEPATASDATAPASQRTFAAMLDRLERLSDLACGRGASTLRQITGRMRARLASRERKLELDGDSSETSPTLKPPPAAEDADSAQSQNASAWVDLDAVELAQPEHFCFNSSYQLALLGNVGGLLTGMGFNSLSVLAFGEIAYAPDTPWIRRHLRRINDTLTGIADLSRLAELWLTNETHRAAQFLADGPLLPALRLFLKTCSSPACQAASALYAESADAGSINDTLLSSADNSSADAPWRRGLSWADWAARRLYYATACFRLPKLRGFNNESALNARIERLLRNFDAPAPSLTDESPAASGPGPQRGPLPRAALLPKSSGGGGGGGGGGGDLNGRNETDAKGGGPAEQLPHLLAALMFDSDSDNFVRYRLRMPEYAVDSTRHYKVLDRVWTPGPRADFPQDFKYFTSFFIHLQELLELAIVSDLSGQEVGHSSRMRLFPSVCNSQDNFVRVIEGFLPMIMTLSWIYSISLLVNAIVYERETRMKELMRIMGLSDSVHWLSWLITSVSVMTISAVGMTALLTVGGIVRHSDPLLLFAFIFSFIVSSVCEAFLISVCFADSSVAAAFAGVVYFIGYVPYSAVDRLADSMTTGAYAAACVIPQLAFGIGCRYVAKWELAGVGLQAANLQLSPMSDDAFAFSSVLLAMWLDAVWLFAAAAYLEQVFPGPYGVPRPLHFPFTVGFWRGERKSAPIVDNVDAAATDETDNDKLLLNGGGGDVAGGGADATAAPDRFEEEPHHLPVGVAVCRLRKVYSSRPPAARFFGGCVAGDQTDGGSRPAKVPAVDCLTVNFYQGQVTSFLGHNGAGKSTTISVLTGLYTPTSGTARIYGLDIRTQMDSVRRCLGLCPQHNILYDSLTVQDHIYFYGMLKGLSRAEIRPQVDSFLRDVGLLQKRHELSKNLSGGMKRRLSVAMAFVGNSKLVVLDEPTAGVDPHARRGIWEVIGKFRTGRTILLTTHHMDEADILGDRICIIDRGRLVCSGSPLFLKKALGDGYALTLVRSAEAPACAAEAADAAALSLVRQEVPDASLAEATTSEIRLRLPASSAASFAALFDRLDAAMPELGVSAYGIEDCSLEEVFLKVTGCTEGEQQEEAEEVADDNGDSKARNGAVKVETNDDAFAARPTSLVQQARALLTARLHASSRGLARWLAELLLPTGFVLLALALLQIVPRDGLNPPLELAPWYLLGTRDPAAASSQDLRTFISLARPGAASSAHPLTRHLRATEQLGTRCMPPGQFTNPRFPCKWRRAGSAWSVAPSNTSAGGVVGRCRCRPESSGGGPDCPARPEQPRRALMSGDLLEDLSGLRGGQSGLADYLRASAMPDYRRRFGGLRLFVENASADAAKAGTVDAAWRSLQLLGIEENNSDSFWSELGRLSLPRGSPAAAGRHEHEVWFDNRGYTAGPAYLNVLHNALLRSLVRPDNASAASAYGISAWTHPVTNRPSWASNAIRMNAFVSAMTVVSVLFALSFVLASFVIFPIAERRSGAKHLQLVSGVPPGLYWLVNHAWNLVNYLAPLAILLALFAAFDSQEFVSAGSLGPTVTLLLLYGLACAPLMYLASWRLGVPSKAYTLLACTNLGLGFVTTMSVTIVRMIGEQNDDKRMKNISEVLKCLFMVLPHFCLGHGLMELNIYYQLSVRLFKMAGKRGVQEYFSSGLVFHSNAWQPTRNYIAALVIQSIAYFSAVLLIEYSGALLPNLTCRQPPKAASSNGDALIDDDVAAEEARCSSRDEGGGGGGNPDTALELRRLTKKFRGRGGRRIAAVRGISLAVGRRECFGFLGVNGAGKTTTFRMLTGDLAPTRGDAFVCGRSVVTEAREVHRRLGYCPQSDAVQPLLTGREVLQLYARIRGVPEHLVPGLVESIARQVGIMQHIDKVTEQYSGGNKRKLSCGVAFIGGPPILFLDEPTAGMDPKARRSLWRCIQGMVARGSCVILTSHSMEDCQALCHRLTIMVNGQLRCIGSPQYLKSKFGRGFTVYLRVAKPQADAAPLPAAVTQEDAADSPKESLADTEMELELLEPVSLTPEMEPAHAAFTAAFPGAQLRSAHVCQLQYRLPGERLGCRLAGLFAQLQAMRKAGTVLDYSVTQTSLDQVFIDFAKDQTLADQKEAAAAVDGKDSQRDQGVGAANC